MLNALASCLVAGLGNIASARGVELRAVRCDVEGDVDLRGLLGIDENVRNGFSAIRVHFAVEGDAPADELADLVTQSVRRSGFYDVVTNGTTVSVEAS